jgi:hypothetical protein
LCIIAYLSEVLVLELGDQSRQTFVISLDSDRLENGLDILGGRGGVTTDGEKKVSCEVLHFESWDNQFCLTQFTLSLNGGLHLEVVFGEREDQSI